jgi:hypothetical protein
VVELGTVTEDSPSFHAVDAVVDTNAPEEAVTVTALPGLATATKLATSPLFPAVTTSVATAKVPVVTVLAVPSAGTVMYGAVTIVVVVSVIAAGSDAGVGVTVSDVMPPVSVY